MRRPETLPWGPWPGQTMGGWTVPVFSLGAGKGAHTCSPQPAPVPLPSLPGPSTGMLPLARPGHPYPDEHREQAAAARGQAGVGIQEVLVDEGVGEKREPGQH